MRMQILLLLICCGILPIFANNYYFRHYENEDGLSHNTVLTCMQDKRGFMWFGTKDGLNRFDGMRFKTFRYTSTTNSIPNNGVTSICEDNQGYIWIGTFNGICCFNAHTEQFHNLNIKGKSITGFITDIKIDHLDHVWFTTYTGIYRYDKKKNHLLFFPANQNFTPNYICETNSHDIWISSLDGRIYKYSYHDQTFKSFSVLTNTEKKESIVLRRICEYDNRHFLISTNKDGIRIFDTLTGDVKKIYTKSNNSDGLIVNDILVTKKKDIWVGADSGLYKYDLRKGSSQAIKNIIDNPYSISDNGIRSLWEDTEGGLWACTFYGGINYLPNETTPFEKYIPSSLPGHIQGKVIRAICGDPSGNIWVGSEDNGLSSFNPITNTFTNYPFYQNIQCLLITENQLWIGSYVNGLYILDLKNKKISHLMIENKELCSIVSLMKSRDNTIYIGTPSGCFRFDKKKQHMEAVHKKQIQGFIHCLFEDHGGLIWIGTYGNGLYSYNTANNQIKHYVHNSQNDRSIGSNYITSIFEDSRQQLWLTTEDSGFCRMDKEGLFTRFSPEKEYPFTITSAMSEDTKGFLWISTTRGLIRFNPNTTKYSVFKKNNGLVDNHFSYNSQYTDLNGKMYFGTIKGMIAFNPSEMKENSYTPSIYITGFYTNGNNKSITEKGKSILDTKRLTIPYNLSSFSVDFIAPSYTNPFLNKYRYILEGFDRDWNYLSDFRKIYYTNVPPGKYLLKVAILDHNGKWTNKETSIQVFVRPPFWASPVAYLIYIIIIGSIFIWIYKGYTTKKNRQHQQNMKELENQKEKELYNAKIQFFTNITHEVRTPLSLIKIPLDKVLNSENLSDFMKDNLSIMKRNVDRLLDLINQLLDFRKTEMEMLQLNFVRTDLNNLVKKTIDCYIPAAEEKNIKLIYHQPNSTNNLAIDQEIITKIISNLLTNALKYSTSLIDVFIEIPLEDRNKIFIRINSNGNHIPANLQNKIFEPFYQIEQIPTVHTKKGTGLGLSLARSLAELHHGKLYLDSSVTEMNSFVLSLPINQEENVKVTQPKIEHIDDENTLSTIIDNSQPTILVVDDEKEITQFIANELSLHYNTLIAYDGNQAIDLLKKEQINMVVSDVLMPETDGYALCNYIKSSPDYCHIPVILLTASVALNSRIVGLESGADGYIEKPFTMELLVGQIDNIFRNKELACKNFISSPLSNYRSIAVNKMDEEFMKRLHATILRSMSDSDFNVEKLASMMNMSMSTLFRKVKAITELSPNEYIRLYKLKRAAKMLVEGNYKINEIAYLVGFSSQSYFATSFQKQFNMTPTDFMKQQKKE